MKIRLWTIQDASGWNELLSKGVLIAKEEFVDPDFKSGYDWMRFQMNEQIGHPCEKDQYPIWSWYQSVNEKKKRPDLRESHYLTQGTTGYRIEIEKAPEDVLLSDFELWHTPLSYKSFIADSELEFLEFEQELLREFGTDSFLELPKNVKRRVEKSWEKIFDMGFDVKYFAKPFAEKQIQATFWELNIDDIIKVDKFIAN